LLGIMLTMLAACGGRSETVSSSSAAPASNGGPTDAAGEAPVQSPGSEAGTCFLPASDYDQSCTIDSDCVPINSAEDWCSSSQCACGATEAINVGDEARYMADWSKTPQGSGAAHPLCLCGLNVAVACCHAGQCTSLSCVLQEFEAGSSPEAGTDLEAGTDQEDAGGVLCSLYAGPIDAAAPDGGPTLWCAGPQTCTTYNGGWACCVQGSGLVDFCIVPRADGKP